MSELANFAVGSDSRDAVAVARQPILDRKGQVIAHELLYRHTVDATACTDRGDSAGARTLNDAVLSVGLDALTCGLPAFINLTHQLLLGGCFMSTGEQSSPWVRTNFRRHFFQHAGARLVRSL